jgi:hypothetical protein
MEAIKSKSKFVYPDKLYARAKDNITLDISYAPQTLKAVEYTRTDAFMKKACEWLRNEIYTFDPRDTEKMIENFKKAMKL